MELIENLGTDKHGYQYFSATDLYVYQYKDGKNIGWICDLPTWEKAMHKLVTK